jgi:hypothetical protein
MIFKCATFHPHKNIHSEEESLPRLTSNHSASELTFTFQIAPNIRLLSAVRTTCCLVLRSGGKKLREVKKQMVGVIGKALITLLFMVYGFEVTV